jgi:copper resistance protein D
MAQIADFVADILGGIELILLALALGGVVWALAILRPFGHGGLGAGAPLLRALRLIAAGAFGLALVQIVDMLLKAYILGATIGRSPFPDVLHTGYFQAGLVRTVLALAMALSVLWLRRSPAAPTRWTLVVLLGSLIAVDGAWLVHGASRFDDRVQLMAMTTIHMLGASFWVGGVVQLVALWRLARRDDALRALWPVAVHRFSALGIVSVLALGLSALPLWFAYVENLSGLVGTGYGAMVVTKTALFAAALGLAAFNFRAGRSWASGTGSGEIARRTPSLIEAETFLLLAILLAAASLSSQPPAIDITNERASWSEMVKVFAPKAPRLTTPSLAEMPGKRPDALSYVPNHRTLGDAWSEFNHNTSGIFLMALALLAFLSRYPGFGWCRHWPLGFVALAVVLFIRSDPEAWPIGPLGLLDSMRDAEVFQHKLATFVALGLGLVEWRARTAGAGRDRLAYVFPFLAAAGGILLLTHSHAAFEIKSEYLIQATHTMMGLFAVLLAVGRWLELRLDGPAGRWAGLGAIFSMFMIGVILTFYRETFVA